MILTSAPGAPRRKTLWRASALLSLVLTACANQPSVPDWQVNAHAAAQRAVQAWLNGQERVAEQEWRRARLEVSRTGDPAAMARLELLACAVQTASLAGDACPRFAALAPDAAAPEQAYAAYLGGSTLDAARIALLPAQQQETARTNDAAHALRITDALSQLVAAGVLLRRGQATPPLVQAAVDTASRQGWRRPLLAWLGVQIRMAEQGGRGEEAAQLRRRTSLVEHGAD